MPSRMFFDRKPVLKMVDRQTRSVLSKFGGFVRTGARSSIRPGKKPALPGRPPHSHQGTLKRMIFFYFDPARKSVIIGPEKLSGKVGDAPHALEFGGRSKGSILRRGRRVVRTVSVSKHPYMGPAAQKESSKLPSLWANSVK